MRASCYIINPGGRKRAIVAIWNARGAEAPDIGGYSMSNPIIVPAAASPAQIAAGARQIAIALGSIAGTLGFSGAASVLNKVGVDPQLAGVIGLVAAGVAFVWGQLATRGQAKKLATVAATAPDSVAQVK